MTLKANNDAGTKKMRLSILIPAIPDRVIKAMELYDKIDSMIGDRDIELVMLMDNKKRSIGAKRESLKNISNAKYWMIVDDDDDLLAIDEIYEATDRDVDCITFKQQCYNSDGSSYVVTFGLGNNVEHKTNPSGFYVDMKRPPFHMCAWNERFKMFSFPDISFGEDWGFLQKALNVAMTEYHIDKIIHKYNFDPNASMAPSAAQVSDGDLNAHPEREGSTLQDKFKDINCIVNLVTNNDKYLKAQKRFYNSFKNVKDTSYVMNLLVGEPAGCPSHQENPYAFKLYAIQKMRDMGYTKILWLDASIVAVKDFTSIFDRIEKNGIFFEDSGWKAGQWTNDKALEMMNVTRAQAMEMKMFSAGFVGFDFTQQVARTFFDNWWHWMKAGAFKGSWENHRHDMSVGSIVASQMGLEKYYAWTTEFFSYIGPGYTPNPESPFELHGL